MMNAAATTRRSHEPLLRTRRCMTCSSKREKADLFRVVRHADGTVAFDPTGRAPGRGAYVCSPACLEEACRKGLMGRALKTRVDNRAAQQIVADMLREHERRAGID